METADLRTRPATLRTTTRLLSFGLLPIVTLACSESGLGSGVVSSGGATALGGGGSAVADAVPGGSTSNVSGMGGVTVATNQAGMGGTAGSMSQAGAGGAAGSISQAGSAGAEPVPLPPLDPNCVGSELYGRMGEAWMPEGRLIDPAFAGYHTGIDPIPDVEGPIRNVSEFGANGADDQDDTQAFLDGIATTEGVLLVPAGRYIITERLEIDKSNLVLRGEGTDQTTLFFPESLGSVYGGDFSFGGGFIEVSGNNSGQELATVTSNAARGSTALEVSSAAGIGVGDWIKLEQTDRGGSLLRAFHGGMAAGNVGEDEGRQVFNHHSRVLAIEGTTLTLERPLPLEVRSDWSPRVRSVDPTTREVGIEHLTMEMAGTNYPGHFNEEGYNAIMFRGVYDSWVRNVTILNADYGVHFNGSYFCTATGVVLDTSFDRGDPSGHHGFNATDGADVLISDFDIRTKYVHDVSTEFYMIGLVVSNGKGLDLCMDHHGRAPYGTLWTNIDMGRATRPYQSGGSSNRMPHQGAYTTLWSVFGANPIGFPPNDYGPLMNFVAVSGTNENGGQDSYSTEAIDSAALCQQNLYEWAVAVRKAGLRNQAP